jgi:hypothetical protein
MTEGKHILTTMVGYYAKENLAETKSFLIQELSFLASFCDKMVKELPNTQY